MVRWIRSVALGVVTLGLLLAAARHPAMRWRASFVRQKASGDLPGVAWRELAARLAPEAFGIQARVGPGPDHLARKLDYSTSFDQPWRLYSTFSGRSGCLSLLDVHFSVLKAGATPHELHQHWAEELLISVSGEAEILRAAHVSTADPDVTRIEPGQFVYHPSGKPHTIRGVEPGPSTYLVLRWENGGTAADRDGLPASVFDYRPALESNANGGGFATTVLFESPTLHLDKLHCHASTLEPGAGYEAHSDSYDVVILLLEGTVETIGQQVRAPSVIVYSAYKPHGMKNPGDVAAKYVVFEFHGCGPE